MKVPEAAVEALKKGRKIEAIRVVRETNGIGLKEAKEAVESHVDAHPELKAQIASNRKVSTPGVATIVIVICLLVIVYMLLWGG